MTFSIAAADPAADQVGVAVQSKFLAVGAIVPWARGGVGACAVQALPDVTVGPRALDRLADGADPEAALAELVVADADAADRQTGLVAADGRAAAHTGASCFPWAGHRTGDGFAVQGNVLAGPQVVEAIAEAFLDTAGRPLAHRLVAALRAGQAAGGEQRGQQSAALVVRQPGGGYGGGHDRLVDLRVDDHERPIEELGRLLSIHDHLFDRAPREAWVPLEGDVAAEVEARLRGGGWLEGRDLAGGLMAYLGWENLEERWTDATTIDPVALAHLREGLPRG